MQSITWAKGLLAAFITGASNGFLAMVVSPETFNTTPEGLKKLGIFILLSGAVGAATYLKQSPVPIAVPTNVAFGADLSATTSVIPSTVEATTAAAAGEPPKP